MSSQRKNTLKNLIKKGMFTTASAAAMILASTNALGLRTVIGQDAVLSTGFNLDGGTPFAPDDDLVLGGLYNFTADVSIGSLNIGANNNAVMTVPANTAINLGNVTSSGAGDGLSVNVPNNGASLTLTGNNYYINNMNFNGTVSTLSVASTVLTPADPTIYFDEHTIVTDVQGQNNLTISTSTPFVVKNPNWNNANAINIGNLSNSRYNLATDTSVYSPGNEVVDIQPTKNINFSGPNSSYIVSNESANDATFIATQQLIPAQDLWGQLGVHAAAGKRTIALNAGSGNGTAGTKRLNIFSTDGIANEAGQSLNDNPVTVTGTIFAQTIQIGNQYQPLVGGDTPYGVDWTTAIDTGVGGLVQFTHNSLTRFQDDVTSDIDFNGKAAQVTIGNGANVINGPTTGGNIDNRAIGGGGAGVLNFLGSSTVSKNIGATNPINTLNVQGDNTKTVNLQGNVTVDQFNYTNTGVAAVGGNLTATTGVNFGNFASTLTFNGMAGPYTFASPVVKAGAATLNVDTNLTVTDQSIGTIQTINIGQVGTPQNLTIAVNQPALSLLAGGNKINFSDSNSTLTFQSPQTQIVTFGGNLDGFAGGGGNVILNGTNALTIEGGSFGVNKAIGLVKTIGTVTANGGINFKSITTLNVTGNSNFTDQTVTSASATNINIGDGNGLGTYILTPNADFNLATLNMKFGDPDSVLNITSNGNVTATMNGDLNPGATDSGIIQLSSTGGNTLILDGVGFNLGTVGVGGNLLNSMTFSGAGNITVVPTINTANALATGIAGDLILNNVNAPINFTTTTNLTVSDVTGAINFGNNAGILNVDNGSTITGTINFGAGTEVTGAVGASNAITLVNFNAGGNVVLDSTSNATNFSIGNNTNVIAGDLMTGAVNYGAGAGTLILQNGLNGAITTSVANTGILTINGGNVSGTIGATGALNLINIGANPVAFGANVNSTNVALTNNASSLTVGSNVVLTSAVTTANPNNGVLNLAPNSSVVGNIGTNAAAIAAVNVGAGPASLAGDVYAGAVALTNALSSLTLNNGTNVNGAITNTSGNNNSGILIFNGGSITGAAGAPGAALNTVTFNANGDLPVASYAQTFNVNNAAIVNAPNGVTGNVVVNSGTFTGNNINGNAAFGGVGTINITTITGQTDFKGSAGTVNVNDTGILQAVTSSTVAAGNLVFLEGGNVTGVINNIGAITVNAAGNKTVIFQKSVSATSLTLGNNAVANLQDSLTTSGNVDFTNGGILEFSGTNLAGYLLNSPITNGNTGTLNVYTTGTTLTATDSSIGTVQTINIGQGNAAAAFTVDVSNKALTLESAINLNNTNSVFGLTTSKNQQVTFTNNVDGFVNGGNAGGTVNLSSTSSTIPNNNVLTLQGNLGNETLGTKTNPLAVINVSGNVGVAGTNVTLGTNKLDVSNTAVLNIAAGGVFADASLTSASIDEINIGDNTANGAATYALDAINTDFDLDAPGVEFKNVSSVLKLMTTSAVANKTSTIYLTGNIDPSAANFGIVELNAENANTTLVINGVKNKGVNPILSLGTANHPLQQIKFSGLGTIEVTAINTKSIDVSVPQLAIGVVDADTFFSGATKLGVVQINGNMDFQNNAGTAIFASDTKNNILAAMTGNITSTGGSNGTVVFMDNGTIGTVDGNGNSTNTITNLAMLQAGAEHRHD